MLSDHAHETMVLTCTTAIAAGGLLMVLSRRIHVPAIVLLLIGGLALGPSGLGIVQPESLGEGLRVIVALGVGIILFEGGLTLDLDGYRSASAVIRRLLSVGVIVTWLSTSIAIVLIFGTSVSLALVSASLVIVTGPTVIGPLLRRMHVTKKLHSILHWEGVLIDPIGVFVAVLCFEWIATQSGQTALSKFVLRVILGLAVGVGGGLLISWAERRKLVADNVINVFALSAAVLIYGISEHFMSEAGLLSVTVAGFVLGASKPVRLEQLREFKADITDLMIGLLFILLAARFSIWQFVELGNKGLMIVAFVMFVVRPLNILVCSYGLDLSWREKLFLSWVAPRGIVAGSMASLIVLSGGLAHMGPDPRFVETFVYSIIIATIILQGFTANSLAKLLGLHDPERSGWIIVGAHAFGREVARFITAATGSPVVLVDTNASAIAAARRERLTGILADARNPQALVEEGALELHDVGNLLALTDNEDLNTLVCREWSALLGAEHVSRWGRITIKAIDWDRASGRLVWSDLPKPSLIGDSLLQESVSLAESNTYDTAGAEVRTPIVSIREGRVVLDPGAPDQAEGAPFGRTLYLQQEGEIRGRSESPADSPDPIDQ